MDYFQTMVTRLLTRYSDIELSAVYDIEQTTAGNYAPVWEQIASKVAAYEKVAISSHGSKWLGYSFIRPAGYQFSGDVTMLGGTKIMFETEILNIIINILLIEMYTFLTFDIFFFFFIFQFILKINLFPRCKNN